MSSLRFWTEVLWVDFDHQWDALSASPRNILSIRQEPMGEASRGETAPTKCCYCPLWCRGGAQSGS